MDVLGKIPPIVIKANVPAPAPVAVKPEVPFVPIGGGDSAGTGEKNPEQQRFEAVKRASQQVADFFVVSDKTFTIFKDVSGQYVTRFTSLRDGKVTYIPEPNLARLGGQNDSPVVTLKV